MWHEWIRQALEAIHSNPHLGLLFAFLTGLSESLPILGTIMPGAVTMTAVGVLIGTATLPGWETFWLVVLGALLGDFAGFLFGKLGEDRVKQLWPFSKYPKWLDKSEAFFKKHGGKSIIIGRFIGPIRSSVPLVASLLKTPWSSFFIAVFPSALLWTVVYLTPGVVLGAASHELPPLQMTEFLLMGALVIFGIWFVVWLIEYFFSLIAHSYQAGLTALWSHISTRSIAKYLQDPRDNTNPVQLRRLISALLFFLAFVVIWFMVATQTGLTHLNHPLFHFIQSIRQAHFDQFFILLTSMGKSHVITHTTLVIALFLLSHRQYKAALCLLAVIGTGVLAKPLVAHIMHQPRPTGFLLTKTGYSFPSGHALCSVVFYAFIGFISRDYIKSANAQLTTNAIITLIIALNLFARLYLGAHWFTDVLAGTCLGLGISSLGAFFWHRWIPALAQTKVRRLPWFLVSLISLTFFYGLYTARHYDKIKAFATPFHPKVHITQAQWWEAPQRYVPLYRHNRFGRASQPFNLQWHAPLAQIHHQLEQQGWKALSHYTDLQYFILRLTRHAPQYHMPLLTPLYRHEPPVLVMIHELPSQKAILELFLWRSNVTFTDSPVPLWIGTLARHTPVKHIISLRKNTDLSFEYQSSKGFIVRGEEMTKVLSVSKRQNKHRHSNVLLIRRSLR